MSRCDGMFSRGAWRGARWRRGVKYGVDCDEVSLALRVSRRRFKSTEGKYREKKKHQCYLAMEL